MKMSTKNAIVKIGVAGFATAWLLLFSTLAMSSARHAEAPTDGIVSSQTAFGFRLYRELAEREPDRNILISPSSLYLALSMAYQGSAGQTAEALAEVLNVQTRTQDQVSRENSDLIRSLGNLDPDVLFYVANSLWADEGLKLKSNFVSQCEHHYRALARRLDFTDPDAPAVISGWIAHKTRQKIDFILDRIDPAAILYLINATYFQGDWTVPFSKENTQDRSFTGADGIRKNVSTMLGRSAEYLRYRNDTFEAVGLPYGDGRVNMYLFLPEPDSSLAEFYELLNDSTWKEWMAGFEKTSQTVILPRFRLEYDVLLNDSLTDMGMGVAFGRDADFGNMISGHDAFIGRVLLKTTLDVHEEGAEAASSAVVEMKRKGGHTTRFNRPFFIAVVDNSTGAILFMGSIVKL